METISHVMTEIEQARTLLDDPLVRATDLDLEVLAAQLNHKPDYKLACQVIAELKARQWAKVAA